jgi:hypothetical protein
MKLLPLVAIAAAVLCAIGTSPAPAHFDVRRGAAAFTVTAGAPPIVAPGAVSISFDDVTAPCLFSQTVALGRFESVKFKGRTAGGGAILDDCGGLGVTGYSPPNVLAFDCTQTLASGRSARLPEILNFGKNDVAPGLTFTVGSSASAGRFLHVTATNAEGDTSAVDVRLGTEMQTVEARFPINKLVLSSTSPRLPVCQLVLDDLTFTRP